MSYPVFLLVFLVSPICLLLSVLRGRLDRATCRILLLTAGAALLYTAPWDNAIILNGVWSFSRARVVSIVIGVVPLEEYLFYVLQVGLTGLFSVWLLRRLRPARD
ncbi:MAG TPA: lycopene cyclase domain-containing protein [Chloroflexota bacterium]|jgi:lycopene cyclase domain-containing protein|nr:lycopene cyclase domain-containing protein [Chloroflexota bacterium]